MNRSKTNTPKKQHYVPQSRLRWFSVGGFGSQVYAFDKWDAGEGQVERLVSIRDAASQNRWNQYELPNGQILEDAFSPVEGAAALALDRVIKTESTRILNRAERADVALFVALQLLRTPGYRDTLRQHHQALGDMLGEAGRRFSGHVPLGRDELRDLQGRIVSELGAEAVPDLLTKVWVLQEAIGAERFVIGDSPVVLRHMRGDQGDKQWIPSVADRGAEVYLPLTPRLTLAMWCRSLPAFDDWRRARVARMGVLAPAPAVPRAALRGERPHRIEAGTTWFLNHMQLQRAHRHVYASAPDFEDLREMIRKDGRLSRPPQMEISPEAVLRSVGKGVL